METMNLNDDGGGMVALKPVSQEMPPQKKLPEKNIVKQHTTMDSTPISDIMDGPDMMQDPRMMQQMMPPMAQQTVQAQGTGGDKKTPNPFNLTDLQMESIVAGVCAIIAFSKPVQEKLATTVPQFLADGGDVSNVGLIVTGLIAALIFYLIQKFMNKRV